MNEKFEKQKEYREKKIVEAGRIGILANFILFSVKFTMGLLTKSIAIQADAFNNFADMGSSIITIFGIKLSNRPPDENHPFGHGRFEYISTLLVDFIVLFFGISFLKESVIKLFFPENVLFNKISVILLVLSIIAKILLSVYNKKLGEKINSNGLKAVAADAFNDVLTTSVVLVSYITTNFTTLPIDAIAGIIISLSIIWNGINLIKETVSPLLGEEADENVRNIITQIVIKHKNIVSCHKLIIHNYGVGKMVASIDVDVDENMTLVESHNLVDHIEKEIKEELDIPIIIHVDPVKNIDGKYVHICEDDVERK